MEWRFTMWTNRQGMIIWLKNLKFARKLRKYGHLIYVSKHQKYIVMYTDQDQIEEVMATIKSLPFVTKVEPSLRPFIKTEYQKVTLDKKDMDFRYDF
jgi:uncharacterized protein YlbG (UPF0298 family)